MKAAAIVMLLPFLVFGQTDGNLDVITLNGRNCPLEGDATSPDVKDLNRLKNRYHGPVASDIDPTVTLTAMVAPGDDETRFDDKSAATVTGFVLKVSEGSKESCNCHASAADQRDTHILLTLSEGADRTQGAIAEVTPRGRLVHQRTGANDWTTAALQRDIQGKWIEITGWLMFDFEHVAEAENTNPGGSNNVRRHLLGDPSGDRHQGPRRAARRFLAGRSGGRPDVPAAQAEHVNRDPKRKRFVEERNEKYRRRFAEDERDDPEAPARH